MPSDRSDLKCDEELHRLLIENSLQGLLILQDERIIIVNKAVSVVSGYTEDELLSFSLDDLMAIVHPADQERIFDGIGGILSGSLPPGRHEFRIVRKDGSIRWVDTLASSIKYKDRPALQLAYLDITERKEIEEERYRLQIQIEEERNKLKTLIESIPDEVWFCDAKGNYNLLNEVAVRWLDPNHARNSELKLNDW
jgi:PAS domain S-box-containing protein